MSHVPVISDSNMLGRPAAAAIFDTQVAIDHTRIALDMVMGIGSGIAASVLALGAHHGFRRRAFPIG